MFSPDLTITAPQQNTHSAQLVFKGGEFYGGKRISITPSASYIFSKHFRIGMEYEYDRIKFPTKFSDTGSSLFQSNLLRLILSYYFSSTLSIKLLSQFDQLNHSISSNLRFRYNPHEGTDLYVVFNQGLNNQTTRLTPHLPFVNNQALIIKFLKTFVL